jgi:hypothetical protein
VPVDPQVQGLLDLRAQLDAPPLSSLPPQQAREAASSSAASRPTKTRHARSAKPPARSSYPSTTGSPRRPGGRPAAVAAARAEPRGPAARGQPHCRVRSAPRRGGGLRSRPVRRRSRGTPPPFRRADSRLLRPRPAVGHRGPRPGQPRWASRLRPADWPGRSRSPPAAGRQAAAARPPRDGCSASGAERSLPPRRPRRPAPAG